jgi:transketolase
MIKSKDLAKRIRIHALNMTSLGGSSHIGSVLSMVDILAVLFGEFMKINPKMSDDPKRDRFILSKGHAGAGIYATLAELGFISKDLLKEHYQNGSLLSGHVSHKGINGIDVSTGSLGHGISIGAGMALGQKKLNYKAKTFVIISDGECDEGSIWEAILFAGHHKLNNLVVIIDYNKIQSMAPTKDVLDLEPFADKWLSFNWEVIEVDGHDHNQLFDAFEKTKNTDKPVVIIAHTVKGKGVSFMENTVLWHYRTARGDELIAALREVEEAE